MIVVGNRVRGLRGAARLVRAALCRGALFAAVLQASVASGAALTELLAGGFVDAGNARFHSWQLASLDATGAPGVELGLITVAPLVDDLAQPGLQFLGNGQLATAGLNALDLVLSYRVQALPGSNSFTAHTLEITGAAFGASGGLAYISEEAVAAGGADLGPNVAIADSTSDVLQLTDSGAFAPHLEIGVNMNVFLSGVTAADAVSLSSFTVRYAQTGPAPISGDFNQDGTVDGADFLKWQRGQSPGPVSPLDLAAWRTSFGQSIAAAPLVAAVPEPTGPAVLLALAMGSAACNSAKLRRNIQPRCGRAAARRRFRTAAAGSTAGVACGR